MKPEVIADWWYCGDEVCDCSYPRVRRLNPPARDIGGGVMVYVKAEMLEEGPFHSQPDASERREQWEWLLAAARRHNADNLAEIEAEVKGWLKRRET